MTQRSHPPKFLKEKKYEKKIQRRIEEDLHLKGYFKSGYRTDMFSLTTGVGGAIGGMGVTGFSCSYLPAAAAQTAAVAIPNIAAAAAESAAASTVASVALSGIGIAVGATILATSVGRLIFARSYNSEHYIQSIELPEESVPFTEEELLNGQRVVDEISCFQDHPPSFESLFHFSVASAPDQTNASSPDHLLESIAAIYQKRKSLFKQTHSFSELIRVFQWGEDFFTLNPPTLINESMPSSNVDASEAPLLLHPHSRLKWYWKILETVILIAPFPTPVFKNATLFLYVLNK